MKRALAQIRQHKSRFAALLLAIAISTGFVVTCLVFVETQSAVLRDQIAASARQADIVVSPGSENPPHGASEVADISAKLAAVPGVSAVAVDRSTFLSVNGEQVVARTSLPDTFQWATLSSGAWPSGAEIVVSAELAKKRNLAIGDTVQISFYGDLPPTTLRVSGIAKDQRSLAGTLDLTAFVDGEFGAKYAAASDVPLWLVQTAPATSIDQVRRDLATAVGSYGSRVEVDTAEEYANKLARQLTADVDVFRALILVFGAIATLVGMLIIANTVTILVAQRRRQIGLMRAIGAQSGQVQRELLIEAAVLGAIGSALGVILGIGLATLGTALLSGLDSGLAVPWTVAISFGIGVVVTVLAAWLPIVRSSSIRPLEALRIAAAEGAKQRPGWATTICALLLLAGGGALLAFTLSADGGQLTLAVGASFLLSLGVLLGAGWYVPSLVRLLGWLPARTGPTARLAVANAVRNPRRTTATCLALMLAVGLVSTLQVGSDSTKASAEVGIAEQFPVALTVVPRGNEPLPAGLLERVRRTDGVTAATSVEFGFVTTGDGETWSVYGVPAAIDQVKPGLRVGPDDLIVGGSLAKERKWTDGQQVSLSIGGANRTMTVRIDHLGDMATAVVAAETFHTWRPEQASTHLWAVVDTRDTGAARSTLEAVSGLDSNIDVGGAIAFIVLLTQILDTLLAIATALLGAAVLIALIGVGNTLGLSVLERTRESALLRALGLQRGQLRAMLAIEAVLLAIAGAIVGIGAGIGFGSLGAWAMMAEGGQQLVLRVSWPMLAVDAGIAVVAGLLASVLPARRAALAAPTEALADE